MNVQSYVTISLLFIFGPLFSAHWVGYMSDSTNGQMIPIDLAIPAAQPPIDVGGTSVTTYGAAISPDAKTLYVVNQAKAEVLPIDITTSPAIIGAPITVGNAGVSTSTSIAITPDGKKAYVTNPGDNTVIPLDLTTNPATTLTTIPVGMAPFPVAITPDGSKAFVGNLGDASISVLDIQTNQVIATISVSAALNTLAIAPNGATLYAPDASSSRIIRMNTSNYTLESDIILDYNPIGIAITPDGTEAYVTNPFVSSGNTFTVTAINLLTHTKVANILLPGQPHTAIAIAPDGKTVYVPLIEVGKIATILTSSHTTGDSISIAQNDTTVQVITITPDQAPTASFTVSQSSAVGQPTSFDASSSSSPIGTIATYTWDFGDGSTLFTSSPFVEHTYASAGSFLVKLTVTNSGDTSVIETFTGQTMSNFGGPSAQVSHPINVQPQIAPKRAHNFIGKIRPHHHKTRYKIQTKWKPSSSSNVASYTIFAFNKSIASINSTEKLHFSKYIHPTFNSHGKITHEYRHFLEKKYKIRAVTKEGTPSASNHIKIKN